MKTTFSNISENSAPSDDFVSPLANELQNQAEQRVLRIMASPEVQAARKKARELLAAHSVSKLPDGKARMENPLNKWVANLAFNYVGSDVSNPAILWLPVGARYRWFGHEFPGSGGAIDNTDNIYRQAMLNGSSSYEIIGKLYSSHPIQFTFHLMDPYGADAFPMTKNKSDFRVYKMHTNDTLVIDADGSFRISLDSMPANGRQNHIQLPPGEMFTLFIRDTLSDWRQVPNELTLHHVGGALLPPAMSDRELIDLTAANLSHHVESWLYFIDHFFPEIQVSNNLVGPHERTGALGWGWFAGARYDLEDDEALVMTVTDGSARYLGLQATDAWMMAPTPREFLGSYNPAQTVVNTDGSKTYIVSVKDPGYANWVETAGSHQGWLLFRWQGVTAEIASRDDLIKSVEVVTLADLPKAVPGTLPKVNVSERQEQRVQRDIQWVRRIAQPNRDKSTGTKTRDRLCSEQLFVKSKEHLLTKETI